MGWGLAVLRSHTFALGVLHEAFLAETAHDALVGTQRGGFRVGTIWDAGGSAVGETGISTAFLIYWKSRDGNSEPEGTNAEQQRESKARVHR